MKYFLTVDVSSYEGKEAVISSLKKLREAGKIGSNCLSIRETIGDLIAKEYKQVL